MNEWYKKAYHRNVVDMHITDYREEFLTELNADDYVNMLKLADVESAVVYTHSHVGYTNFPTKYGCMHPNLKGRDIFKEISEKCSKSGIKVIAYFSLIFDLWAYKNNPEWNMRTCTDKHWDENIRFGVCCPNSGGYRNYLKNIVTEICENYDFDGIRFDMTFWPGYCYCNNCKNRFMKEYGAELPQTVNWFDKTWVAFQRARENWLVDFAKFVTDTVRSVKPEVTVEHQSSTYNQNCGYGVSADLRDHSDFLQGDFYGGYTQGSMACKLFYNLSPNLPFGYEVACNESLRDHTTLKKDSMLYAKTLMSIANGGAFVFIDAIDPVGTLNKNVYSTFGRIFEKTHRYAKYMGGQLIEDAVIYLSTESKCSLNDNGKHVSDLHNSQDSDHVNALMGATSALIKNHVPFGIITRKNLDSLNKYKLIILPNVLMLSKTEIDAIKEYVKNGGKIYASKYTSLIDTDGDFKDNFMLSDVFGVNYESVLDDKITFISPFDKEFKILPEHVTEKYPLHINDSQINVNPTTSQVLWKMGRTWTKPYEKWPFVSIHSDPPGYITDYPSLTINNFGEGKAYYCATTFENQKFHDKVFADLVKDILDGECTVEGNIPRQVEITLFRKENGILINLLTLQDELPNLPIPPFELKIKQGSEKISRVLYETDEIPVDFTEQDGYITFKTNQFDTFTMYFVEFK